MPHCLNSIYSRFFTSDPSIRRMNFLCILIQEWPKEFDIRKDKNSKGLQVARQLDTKTRIFRVLGHDTNKKHGGFSCLIVYEGER
jgi:hypothetical protein